MFRALIKSQGVRQAFALGAGTAIGQAAVVVASPIWSRLYEPAAFGRYGLILSFLTATTVAVGLRYELAIPIAKDDDEALVLLLLAFLCSLAVATFLGVVFLGLCLLKLLGFGEVAPSLAAFVALSLVLSGTFSAVRYWQVRCSGFRTISISLVVQGFGRALTPIALAPLNWGWLGLISGEMVGRSFGIRSLGKSVYPELKHVVGRMTVSRLKRVARSYIQYPSVFLPSSILDALSGAVTLPVVVSLYGLSAGGEYLLAQQIITAPSALLSGSLGDVFHARLVPSARNDLEHLPRLVVRASVLLLAVASLVYLPIACLAPYLAGPVFGARWSRVGEFITILAPSAVIATMVSPISRAMLVSRIPQIKFLADIAKLVLPIVGLVGTADFAGASVAKSLMVYSGTVALSYLIYLGIVLYSVRPSNQIPGLYQKS